MNNGASDMAPVDVPPPLPSQPCGIPGAPTFQGWGKDTVRGLPWDGPLWLLFFQPGLLTSPVGCESHPDWPAA